MNLVLKATFGSNVRIGTGSAANGLDETIDRAAPLSAAAVKGVLREEARWLLPGVPPTDPDEEPDERDDHPFVQAVFGARGGEKSPWNFDVVPDAEPNYTNRASLQLDEKGHVVDGALLIKEEASIKTATITITPRSVVGANGLPSALGASAPECHLALLHLAARATEKLGQRRTRGMGWLTFECPGRSVQQDLDLVWTIREGSER